MIVTEEVFTEVVQSLGFEIESKRIDRRPDGLMGDMKFGSTHWDVTIRFFRDENDDGSSMQIFYSMGPAHVGKPMLMDVIYSVVNDCTSVDYSPSLRDFAAEFGYTNLNVVRQIFQTCQKSRTNFIGMVGMDNYKRLTSAEMDY